MPEERAPSLIAEAPPPVAAPALTGVPNPAVRPGDFAEGSFAADVFSRAEALKGGPTTRIATPLGAGVLGHVVMTGQVLGCRLCFAWKH